MLDGDCVGYLLGVVMGGIIGISVGKTDVDKVCYLIVIIIGTILNTELVNCKGFSLYLASSTCMCNGGLMHAYCGRELNLHWEAHLGF